MKVTNKPIQFIDLKTQQQRIRSQIETAIMKVLDHGSYVMGPEIELLEEKLAEFCGVKYAISCSNGTDALVLVLMAKKVMPGQAIFVPSFTFAATAEVVAQMGAAPIFIDVLPDTYNMDPESLKLGIITAKKLGLIPAGIIPVDLFGQPADYDAIQAIAYDNNLWILSDAAQSFGGTYKDLKVGNLAEVSTTSFFPAKPLGCYGDGGAIFTSNDELCSVIKSLRVHGQGTDKYDNILIGMNGRMDTIQAAILIEKLKIFPEELKTRQKIADYYNEILRDFVKTPYVISEASSSWAQYTIRLPKKVSREKFILELKNAGIPTAIYYLKSLHQQKAYSHFPVAGENNLPVSEMLANEVISLPMNGYLDQETLYYIAETCVNVVSSFN